MSATTTHRRAAQAISLAFNGIGIVHIKANPNRWDGYDLDLEDDGLLRVTLEFGSLHVMTFTETEVMLTHATFSVECPPMAVAAYIEAMIR